MLVWKMNQNLTRTQDPELDRFATNNLGEGVHEERKKGFLLARLALLEGLEGEGHKLSINQLRLLDYSTLEILPQYTISLSHTKGAGAALIAEKDVFKSVGLDIELDDRVVKNNVAERISHPNDQKIRKIELWCLKEAAFKALMNSGHFDKPVDFSSIVIEKMTWTHSPSGIQGEWEIENVRPYLVARAYLKN